MAEVVFEIAGKICPLMSDSNGEVYCTERCSSFHKVYTKGGSYCGEEVAEKMYQRCSMWPPE